MSDLDQALLDLPALFDAARHGLDDDDIKAILDVMGSAAHAVRNNNKRRSELKETINGVVALWAFARSMQGSLRPAPHKLIAEVQKIATALSKACDALNSYIWIDDYLAVEADRRRGKAIKVDRFGGATPSQQAMRRVRSARRGLALLLEYVESCERSEHDRQAKLGTKKNPRQADPFRQRLIVGLSRCFERYFGLQCATDHSLWCSFLAGVLTRCEKHIMTKRAAAAAWLRIQKRGLDREDVGLPTALRNVSPRCTLPHTTDPVRAMCAGHARLVERRLAHRPNPTRQAAR